MPNPILDALIAARLQQLRQTGIQPGVGVNSQGTLFPDPGRIPQAAPGPINLGSIPIIKPQSAFAAPVSSPGLPPTATPPITTTDQWQTQKPKGEMSPFMQFLKQMGVPLAAAVAGTAFPGALPAAAGLSTGYAAGMEKAMDRNLEQRKIDYDKAEKKQKNEKDKWDDSYKSAEELIKIKFQYGVPEGTDILAERDAMASSIYKLRYGKNADVTNPTAPKSTEQISSAVSSKYKIGDTVNTGGKSYKVVGFDTDGEPLVE